MREYLQAKNKAGRIQIHLFSNKLCWTTLSVRITPIAVFVNGRSEAKDAAKTIPQDTSSLNVRDTWTLASLDAADTWMPSGAGSVSKGFNCGIDSWTASVAAKASEWTEERQERMVKI